MFSAAQWWPLFLDDKCVGNKGEEEQQRGSQLASIGFSLMETVTQNNLEENKLVHPEWCGSSEGIAVPVVTVVAPKAVGLSLLLVILF